MKGRSRSLRLADLLCWCYFPVAIALGLTSALGAIFLLLQALEWGRILGTLLVLLAAVFGWTAFQVALGCIRAFGRPLGKYVDRLEIHPPPAWIEGLQRLTTDIAQRHQLPEPDDIRLHGNTVAHVYEEPDGRKVLVIGGIALAVYSQSMLAATIAHELAHFDQRDTAPRRTIETRSRALMEGLQAWFREDELAQWNPLGWLLLGYYELHATLEAAASRRAEYAADRRSCEVIGQRATAEGLLLDEVLTQFSWARLDAVADWCFKMNMPGTRIFSEQVRRARSSQPHEWRDMCQKALRRRTGRTDSHPALRDRLEAVGVSEPQALQILGEVLARANAPASNLLPNWDLLEKLLSERVMQCCAELHQLRRDMAMVLRSH